MKSNIFFFLGIIVLMMILSILIGPQIVNNTDVVILSIYALTIIFIINKKIIHKKQIINLKTDLFFIILSLSAFIPLIFSTYASLDGTVDYIFKYIAILCIYIITRNIIFENKNYIKNIIDVIIICSIILILFGIDSMTTNFSKEFVSTIIGTLLNEENETKMFSLFKYNNTFAIFTVSSIILVIARIFNNTEKQKSIYIGLLFIMFSAVLISSSKTSLLLLIISIIMYLLLLKPKEQKLELIKIIIYIMPFAIIYSSVFINLKNTGQYYIIWILALGLSILLGYFSKPVISNKFFKIKFVIIIVVLIFIGFICVLNIPDKLVLFNNENSAKETFRMISNINSNEDYTIEINLKTINDNNNFTIEVVEMNKYNNKLKRNIFEVNNYEEKYIINIKTTEDTKKFRINFKTDLVTQNTLFEIYSMKINNKDYIVNYKYLPTELVNGLKNLSLNQYSSIESFSTYEDAIKLIKQSPIFGMGGNAWKYMYPEVQTYNYTVLELHCYPLQTMLYFGMVGIIGLIGLFITFIYYTIKYLRKNKNDLSFISVVLALLVIILHSFVDFDMTFLFIMYIVAVLFGIVFAHFEFKNIKLNKIITYSITYLFIILLLICSYFKLGEMYYEFIAKKQIQYAKTYEEKTNLQNTCIFLNPYNIEVRKDRANYIKTYEKYADNLEVEQIKKLNKELLNHSKIILENEKSVNAIEMQSNIASALISLNKEEINKETEKLVNSIERLFSIEKCDYKIIYFEYTNLYYIIRQQESYENNDLCKKLCEIMFENYDKDILKLSDYESCNYSKDESEKFIIRMKELKEEVNKIYEEIS